jgi:hypothetical protein
MGCCRSLGSPVTDSRLVQRQRLFSVRSQQVAVQDSLLTPLRGADAERVRVRAPRRADFSRQLLTLTQGTADFVPMTPQVFAPTADPLDPQCPECGRA